MALREHAITKHDNLYDGCVSSFFSSSSELGSRIAGLKARAILIDMEEGVIAEIMRSPLKDIFNFKQLITDVSGSGNNWAVANCFYGQRFASRLRSSIRKAAELCDSLQCFFIIHSLGGGTGSGIGTFVLEQLRDDYDDVYRLC
ncbi:unnamed protein product [Protopolystoma xenopodis]|uniref:Tubulin/FtsZ GTPase domain-containing protein n=1 Tax=Protopolystoma xenopodis TaxID=117903 RepID=A0A3S5BL52_9PLAT|nr:unnamed protein product [Protopolystoma xenopodis]